MKKTVWVNTVIRNEENFIWYGLMSVLDFVDKILVYDMGSTDKTIDIIKSIKSKKIILKEFSANSEMITHAKVRQQMLDETKSDWVLLLDGDEIWLDRSIKTLRLEIEKTKVECLVVPTIMLLGDVYHYQEEKAGDYHIAGKVGHYNLRAFKKDIPGLHVEIHPNKQGYMREGFFDKNKKLIYERGNKNVKVINTPYLHASHLQRSSKDQEVVERAMRFKYELGIPFPKDFKYPLVFYLPRPQIVPSPWKRASFLYKVRAGLETPLKKIKRRFIRGNL